jgi:ABC-2 type transport system permease protein
VGVTALAELYGAVIPTIPDLVASNPDLAGVIGASSTPSRRCSMRS